MELQPAFVLHRRAYSESSVLVDIFTPAMGTLRVVAKGMRGDKRQRGNLLQPCLPLWVSWSGKGQLKNLLTVERNQDISLSFPSSLALFASYLNELLLRLVHTESACDELFFQYAEALVRMSHAESIRDCEPVLRNFELHLFDFLGIAIDFGHDAQTGEPLFPQQIYQYRSEQGFVMQSAVAHQMSSDALSRSASLEPLPLPLAWGQHLINIANGRLGCDELMLLKRLHRARIDQLLEGRPLNSRTQFLQQQQVL